MTVALVNGRVLTDEGLTTGQAVLVDGAHIKALLPTADLPTVDARHDLGGALLLPGFIDVQVNGGGGALFNDAPTVETIAQIGRAHRRYGTTGFLPTLISDDLDTVRAAIAAADDAIVAGIPGVLGVHIEGPFLSRRRKGIHDAAKFRDLDEAALALLSSAKSGRTLVTLAPEETEPAMIRRLVETGVIVSAGHTDGAYADIRAALDNGLSGFTHLFNAMSPLTSREPGAVGAALEDQSSWCGLIVDGRHVDPVVLKIALRCKPTDRFMLVTDAMPSVGMVDKTFKLQGRTIRVEGGVCIDETGTLAGSDLDMASTVRNAMTQLDLDLATAVAMASRHPASFLGLEHELGRIAPSYRASFVVADDRLNVLETWIDGSAQ